MTTTSPKSLVFYDLLHPFCCDFRASTSCAEVIQTGRNESYAKTIGGIVWSNIKGMCIYMELNAQKCMVKWTEEKIIKGVTDEEYKVEMEVGP